MPDTLYSVRLQDEEHSLKILASVQANLPEQLCILHQSK